LWSIVLVGQRAFGHAAEQLLEPLGGSPVHLQLPDNRDHAGHRGAGGALAIVLGDFTRAWRDFDVRRDVRHPAPRTTPRLPRQTTGGLPTGDGVERLRRSAHQLVEILLRSGLVHPLDFPACPVREADPGQSSARTFVPPHRRPVMPSRTPRRSRQPRLRSNWLRRQSPPSHKKSGL